MSGHTFNAQPIRIARTGTPSVWSDVDLAAFQRFVRLGTTGANTELREILVLAGPWVENATATTLSEDTLVLTVVVGALNNVDIEGSTMIQLPFGPVTAVTSVAWTGGSETSLTLETNTMPERVKLPTTVPADALEVDVTYTAGRTNWAAFTSQEQFAVYMALSHFWQNREAVSSPKLDPVPFMMSYALAAIDRSTFG